MQPSNSSGDVSDEGVYGEEDSNYDEQDDEDRFNPRFCTNCTARIYGHVCDDCGHCTEQDAQIFDANRSSAADAGAAQQIALLWDERMALHEEGKSCPHPERPDRIKAVMARLLSSGLSGMVLSCSVTQSLLMIALR